MTQMNLFKKQTQAHQHSEQTCGCQWRGEGWNGSLGLGDENYYIENAVLMSAVEQSDSVIHYIYIYTFILFYILFHYGLSQNIEYSYLRYTVGPCYLSTLYIIVFNKFKKKRNSVIPPVGTVF